MDPEVLAIEIRKFQIIMQIVLINFQLSSDDLTPAQRQYLERRKACLELCYEFLND